MCASKISSRTLVLELAISQSVKLRKLSDSDSDTSYSNYCSHRGGLEMAMSCDLRICGENAILGLPETGLAIISGAGGTQRLPRLIGKAKAKELIFTGRKVGSVEAVSIGLVNYCVPAGEADKKALEFTKDINDKGPIATRMAKKAINEGLM